MAWPNPKTGDGQRLAISIGDLTRVLAVAAGFVALTSLVTQMIAHQFDLNPDRLSFSFFNVDAERNIPTTFQALLFLGCALALAGIAAIKHLLGDRWRRYWVVLSVTFAGLAWDEITEIHEHFIHLLQPLGLSGIFYFAWIVPAAFIVALYSVAFARFVLALRPPFRGRLIAAGVVFMFAVFPLEALGGWYFERIGESANMRYVLLTTVEETLEMVALIAFLQATMTYLAAALAVSRIELAGSPTLLWLEAGGPVSSSEPSNKALRSSCQSPSAIAETITQAEHLPRGRD